ncbi:ribosome recycling factor, partial [Tilletiaria anomala UBC 951]
LLDDLRVTIGKDTSSSQPLREIATVGARNGVLFIHCFDSSYVKDVEKAIYASQLNLAPQVVSGDEEGTLRVPVPKPTVETRKELLKDISRICESARVSIRSARHAAQKQIKADIDGKIVGSSEGKALMKKVRAGSASPRAGVRFG